jgi:hypothetical protein
VRTLPTVLLLAFATACKPPCGLDDADEAFGTTRDDVLREQKRVNDGKPVCPAYFPKPRIVATGADVVIEGAKKPFVSKRDETPANELRRNEPLFKRLKEIREYWKQLHPGQDFPGRADIAIDPTLETARAASITTTTAFAGYTNQGLQVGTVRLEASYFVPPPPTEERKGRAIVVVDALATPMTIRFRSAFCVRRLEDKTAATAADVAPIVDAACAGKPACIDAAYFYAKPASSFGETASLIQTVLSKPSFAKARFVIRDRLPDVPPPPVTEFGFEHEPIADDDGPCPRK